MFDKQAVHGAYFAISAYVFWGMVPIYFKLLDHVSAPEILIQRVIWSVVLLLGLLAYTGQLPALKIPLKKLGLLFCTALLLAGNWLVFIYAIINHNIVETSLGYFINPLISVLLGMIFLGERLRPLQWLAIVITFSGIMFQLIYFGAIPWIALFLAFSFGFYGLLRKNLNLPAIVGLGIETLLVLPIALVGMFWLYQSETMVFAQLSIGTDLLLVFSGFVTSFPLLCFSAAVTRLSLTAAGMFQYIAPSMSLIIATVFYGEAFGIDRLITFACIWAALLLFTFESLYHHRKLHKMSV